MIKNLEELLGKENIEKIEEKDWKPVYIEEGSYVLINFSSPREKIKQLEKELIKLKSSRKMLNKVKLTGKVISLKIKERIEDKELKIYFSLEVPNPNNATTILRCVSQGEIAERIEKELQKEDIIEVRGYLRNERNYSTVSDGEKNRQILTKITDFVKLDIKFEEIDKKNSNQVRLIGKIITDFKDPDEKRNPELLTFKIEVPRERNPSPLFFCRAQGELVADFNQHLSKGDIIFLEGFLQAKKIYIDYKDTDTLRKFINRQGRIVRRTYTQLTTKTQRQVTKSIKRARQMALLPYSIVEQSEPIYTSSRGQSSGHTKGVYGGKSFFGSSQVGAYGGHYSGSNSSERGILLAVIAAVSSSLKIPAIAPIILVTIISLTGLIGTLFPTWGKKFEVKEFAKGFVLNYFLHPKNKKKEVLLANQKNLEWLKEQKIKLEQEELLLEQKSQELYQRINNFSLSFDLKKNEKGNPFGSVSSKEILQELEKHNFKLEKNQLSDFRPFHELGEKVVKIENYMNKTETAKLNNFEIKKQMDK
ncbi:5534_t:CDS:2 [Funneliformis geosporum]|uniref:Small ribosomal subunit protein bS18m n=1 Tax=Funneliformis geosporum TaxID=1117311 RepID=A0A9W4SC57_9GLOM|nr:5534_t:CDS:2 [Funneliformis geosporum]